MIPVARKVWQPISVWIDSGGERAAADHAPNIGLEQGIAGQLARAPAQRTEEWAFAVLGDAGPRRRTPPGSGPDCGGLAWRAPCRVSRAAAPSRGAPCT